ncbi:chorismate mutase [Latilactobacillus sakei]|uniref:chorismate mutase n=1 Tax=Latilactobacillus sakei TaxID=1599 RepID=UPI000C6F14C6|nr:chorismate mutase [Latilactobacillus sakei]
MLEEQYQKIDALDQQLADLFEQRMAVVDEIAQIKFDNQIGLTNIQREKAVMDQRLAAVEEPKFEPYIVDLYQTMILIAKQYQVKKMKALKEQAEA